MDFFQKNKYTHKHMFTCVIFMGTKTITIKEEVYNSLLSLKRKDESFSDLLDRLTRKENPLDLLEQMAGTVDFGDTKDLIDEIRSKRSDWR